MLHISNGSYERTRNKRRAVLPTPRSGPHAGVWKRASKGWLSGKRLALYQPVARRSLLVVHRLSDYAQTLPDNCRQ
jgi:hypothetical protein